MRSEGANKPRTRTHMEFSKNLATGIASACAHVIEVLSHHFDHLSDDDKTRVIIHELMHIPKNFSGALVPHRGRHTRIDHRTVERLFQAYKEARQT